VGNTLGRDASDAGCHIADASPAAASGGSRRHRRITSGGRSTLIRGRLLCCAPGGSSRPLSGSSEAGVHRHRGSGVHVGERDADAARLRHQGLREGAGGRRAVRLVVHGLRQSHATLLLRDGVPVHIVAKRLGHKDPSVTLNVYADVKPDDDGRAVEVSSRAVWADDAAR
jgi:Phage integrase family